jgi:LysW-gamma-L-lysine carboxypeptidase
VEYAVKLLKDLLNIYSPTGCESNLGRYLEESMNTLGFNVSVDEIGNVIGETGNEKQEILLCGHMDTVPGEIPVSRDDFHLYGRGAVDAKGSLAAMIVAANKAVQEGCEAKIKVACLVDEEGKSRGAQNLIKTIPQPDYVVIGEPSGTNNIIIGYKGCLKITYTISSMPAHSASPRLSNNAIEAAIELWNNIKNKLIKDTNNDSYFHSISGCLTKINGGGEFNITPSHCIMETDIRIPPEVEYMKVYTEIEKLAAEQIKGKTDLTIRIEKKGSLNAILNAKDSPLVAAFSIAIRRLRGVKPILLKKTGSSDMNVLVQKWKIPMIAYGPGDSKLDHTPNEKIDIREYLASIDIYKEAIKWLAKRKS